jgi:hypothetical protein
MTNYGPQEVPSMDKELEKWLDKKREIDVWLSCNRPDIREGKDDHEDDSDLRHELWSAEFGDYESEV